MHGFTDVDRQPDPKSWVGVLDRLSGEPFYQAYQQRVRELLRPSPGRRYLDVGAGTGASAVRLRDDHDVTVLTVDRSLTMALAMRARGLTRCAVADAHRLPFLDDSIDGAWADRTVQHLADPRAAIRELARVVRPGGRIVLADPDYDTQVLDIADQDLARRVLRFRADCLLRNGTLAHQHAGILATLGLAEVTVEPRTLLVRNTRTPPTTFSACAVGPVRRLSAAYSTLPKLARSRSSSTTRSRQAGSRTRSRSSSPRPPSTSTSRRRSASPLTSVLSIATWTKVGNNFTRDNAS
ncbi:methyltransferase domain-containing protein [Micromonospora chalcea]|uniref:methyltransferase domain-containing protein n=1 Tax=Micromonospora chalcea TaxID=1874 RepID=UPI003D7406DA